MLIFSVRLEVPATTPSMNQRLLWTTVALLTPALAEPAFSQTSTPTSNNLVYPVSDVSLRANPRAVPPAQQINSKVTPEHLPTGTATNSMGIARVQPHELAGRMAATLYVRNVPVLTFTGSQSFESINNQVGASGSPRNSAANYVFQQLNEPIWRATAVAAKINQVYLDNVDAKTIKAVWDPGVKSLADKEAAKTDDSGRYLIKAKDTVLAEIDASTRLPDTISDRAKDALQATNRLRKLIGDAPPLHEISGRQVQLPRDQFIEEIATSLVRIGRMLGLASWYGVQDNGKQTASGEVFNDNELTAAHRDLPFGTKVLVTNRQNGRSVIVRINDRGPYVPDRIIDLSTAAADLLGMFGPGVVPVNVDILGKQVPGESIVGTRPAKNQN